MLQLRWPLQVHVLIYCLYASEAAPTIPCSEHTPVSSYRSESHNSLTYMVNLNEVLSLTYTSALLFVPFNNTAVSFPASLT